MKEEFKGFMEDFNTATMPHAKYYGMEKYEREELERERATSAQLRREVDRLQAQPEHHAESALAPSASFSPISIDWV